MASSLSSRPPFDRLLELLLHERRAVGYVYLYAALAGLFSLTLPLGVQALIGLVSGGMLLQPAILLIAFVVLGTAAAGGLQLLQLSVIERLQQRVMARFAIEVASLLPRTALEPLAGTDLPETTNRFFEVVTIQKSISKLLLDGVTALLSVIMGLLLLTLYHPYFSFLGAGLVALLALLLKLTGRYALQTAITESTHKYRIAHWLQELAREVRLFKLAPDASLPLGRVDGELTAYLKARQAHFRIVLRQATAIIAVKTLITAALLIMGSVLVLSRAITLGQFVAAEIVIVLVLSGVEKLSMSLTVFYDLLAAMEKAGHLRDLPTEESRGTVAVGGAERGFAVEARDLRYRYPGSAREALRGVALRIGAGECVAIACAEGAGASTMTSVLSGLAPGFEGAVTLDGVSLRDIPFRMLRRQVATLDDLPGTFDGSLEENVLLGRPGLAPAEAVTALRSAGLADWLAELPAGLATPVGPAEGLPPHVTRRIALARTLVGRPRLIMIDQFLRDLDPQFRRDTLRLLRDGTPGWSVLLITRDPSVLAETDRIYLLEDGAITAEGRWPELLENRAFARLVGDPSAREAA